MTLVLRVYLLLGHGEDRSGGRLEGREQFLGQTVLHVAVQSSSRLAQLLFLRLELGLRLGHVHFGVACVHELEKVVLSRGLGFNVPASDCDVHQRILLLLDQNLTLVLQMQL